MWFWPIKDDWSCFSLLCYNAELSPARVNRPVYKTWAMLRAICRFSRGAQSVLIYRNACDNQSTECSEQKEGNVLCPPLCWRFNGDLLWLRRRRSIWREITLFWGTHFAHCTTIFYVTPSPFSKPCIDFRFFFCRLFCEYYYTLHCSRNVSFLVLIFFNCKHNEAENCVHWLCSRDTRLAIKWKSLAFFRIVKIHK